MWADLITTFKILTSLLNVGPNLFFFSLALDVALEVTLTGYSKVRTTAEVEGREILE